MAEHASPQPPPQLNDLSAWRAFQRYRNHLIVGAVLLSLIIHFASFEGLGGGRNHRVFNLDQVNKAPVKIKIVEVKPKTEKKKEEAVEPDIPKILETPQTKTERPKEAEYVGTVDHIAKKETRVADEVKRERAKDAGQKGNPNVKTEAKVDVTGATVQPKPQKQAEKQSDSQIKSKIGKLSMETFQPKPRNDYEALLPTSITDLPGQLDAGFQDYVDDKIQNGDRIDMNTTEYRYIGYFTNMRKAIELVWNYPLEAARKGLQGEVGLEFSILKDGKTTHIRVLKSSGYEILDKAIIEAIKLASPFSPLPSGFKKEKIVVTGSFRYILGGYGSH